jgi:MSHA biogenesis protein MshJ
METVKQYRTRFEQLKSRERGLVLVIVLALIYGLWSVLINSAQESGQRLYQTQLAQIEMDLQAQRQQLNDLKAKQGQDPDAELRRQVAQTKLDIKRIDEQLAGLSVGLIPAHELAKVLENVLLQSKSLKLVSLETLPIEQLELKDSAVDENADMVTGIYKHRVKVRLEGRFFEIAQYLAALEQLPWRFYWSMLTYEVGRYPAAETVLEVYTLSTERGSLGA